MKSDQFRRLEELYHAASAREGEARAHFLREACAGDAALRGAVERLLEQAKSARGMLDEPALAAAARFVVPPGDSTLSGRRIGPYEVQALLGMGGMGEVYRARDTKLGREVAIKILPAAFSSDRDRLARFEREARLLAALNHPHIGAIYGVEDMNGVPALVLELVEGVTLADRLKHGAVPLPEALAIARQIAEALRAAHERGVVHRDLKPANIKMTPDGTVKVLDFGLAKVSPQITRGNGGDLTSDESAASHKTRDGAILGTIQYMSPEQARGQSVDKRTDIWAFGCVLFEMLTGHHAFVTKGLSDTLAAVLTRTPDWTVLDPSTPSAVRRLLRRCLEKDKGKRLADLADACLEIDDALSGSTVDDGTSVPPAATRSTSLSMARTLPWAIVVVLGLGWLGMVAFSPKSTKPEVRLPQRLSLELGGDGMLPTTDAPFALSADGTLLAFVARPSGTAPQVYVRRLDQLTATPLRGTEGASSPFVSPDGRWVAFFADRKLKKVSVQGGPVITLADAPNPRGGCWADDGTIVFTPDNRVSLRRVSEDGGDVQKLTELVDGEISHRFPQVLPGSAAVLYTASRTVDIAADVRLVVQSLPSGERTVVHPGGYFGRYVPGSHLLYMLDGTLFALPFDPQRRTVIGRPRPVVEGITSDPSRGSAQVAASLTGTLVYLPGQNSDGPRPIMWMDRSGTISSLNPTPVPWGNVEFSPDGSQLAMDVRRNGRTDIWRYEWTRDTLTRLTSEASNAERPLWTPGGERIVYRTFDSLTAPMHDTLSWRRADGRGDAQVLIQSSGTLMPGSWHPTTNLLAYVSMATPGAEDIMVVPVEGDEAGGWSAGQPKPFLNSAARERAPAFSPDGRWIAYHSNESGRDEVYVRPFPASGSKVMVSSSGGFAPSWSRTRQELMFTVDVRFAPPGTSMVDYAHILMVVPYRIEHGSFHADKARVWAEGGSAFRFIQDLRNYALHPDGDRVAIAPRPETEARQNHVTLVLNFADELGRIAPANTGQ